MVLTSGRTFKMERCKTAYYRWLKSLLFGLIVNQHFLIMNSITLFVTAMPYSQSYRKVCNTSWTVGPKIATFSPCTSRRYRQ